MEALGKIISYLSHCYIFCFVIIAITYFRPLSLSLELLSCALFWSGCKLFFSFAMHPFHHFHNHISEVQIQLCYTSAVLSSQCSPNIWHPHPGTQDSLWQDFNSLWSFTSLSSWFCEPIVNMHNYYYYYFLILNLHQMKFQHSLPLSFIFLPHCFPIFIYSNPAKKWHPLPFFSFWGSWLSFTLHKCCLLIVFPSCTNLEVSSTCDTPIISSIQ